MILTVKQVQEFKTLNRTEIECVFKNISGILTRQGAVDAIKKELKINDNKIYLIYLKRSSGINELNGLFYVYKNEELAKRYLPKYIINRNTPKAKPAEEAKPDEEAKPAEENKSAAEDDSSSD